MPTFVLNNGTKYECSFCGLASVGILYVDIVCNSLVEALTVFSNTENTKHMEYITSEDTSTTEVYDGYTKILGVEYAFNDASAIRVSLRKLYEGEK